MTVNRSFCLVIIVFALSACAAFVPKEHLIPKQRLVDTLQKQFPLYRERGAGLFSITIDSPQLSLIHAENRINVNGNFIAKAATHEIEGSLMFSSGLRYDPEQRAVFLKEARIDSLQSKNGKPFPELLRAALQMTVGQSIIKQPIYRFRPRELVVHGVEIDVDAIDVVEDGVLLRVRAAPM